MKHKDNRFHEIARIDKVHGLDGTVKVTVQKGAETFFDIGSLLYLKNRRGDMIPARIIEIRTERRRKVLTFFVKFDRIDDRSKAESLRDTPVYSDEELTEIGETETDSVQGYEVRDPEGLVGYVASVMENPAHRIIEVSPSGPEDSGNLLIPWVDEYVKSVEEESQIINCRNLNQLNNL